MMRMLGSLGIGLLLILSIQPSGGISAEPSGGRSPANVSDAGSTEPVYLGHAVSYWVQQARVSQPAVPRARIVEALVLALESKTPEVRLAAGDALGALGRDAEPAIPILVRLAGADESAWVRSSAAETVAGMGTAALPQLVEQFRTSDAAVKLRIASVLASIGPAAGRALPDVEQALQNEPADVRGRIGEVLSAIKAQKAAQDQKDSGARLVSRTSATATSVSPASVADWPQFRGPHRDAISTETGLLKSWPESGLELLWKMEGMGKGFSSVSIVDGTLFTMGDRSQGESESQFLLAFDLDSRQQRWAVKVGPPHRDGPRSTPTVDHGAVYAIGTDGDLVCADAENGTIRWRKNFAKDFGGQMMSGWKYSESPLVDGDRVVCTPGGADATIVALDKRTGELIWKCSVPTLGPKGKDGAAYSSIVAGEIGGVRQYVQLLGRGVVGVDAATGRFLWGYNTVANSTANITSPVIHGDHVFCTTSYRTGSALLKITRDGEKFHAQEVYFLDDKQFANHHGGVVLIGDHIYGGDGQNKGAPVCLELATGKIAWKEEAPERGSAAVLYADGNLIFRYDRGTLALVEATPEAFRIKGKFTPLTADGPAWAHPVIHDGKLYLRHNDLLACYSLMGK